MSEFKPGLEGVVAFETQIAEPDRDGGSLRYRGVDIEDIVGTVSYGNVWGLLVDGSFKPGLQSAEHCGCRSTPVTSGPTCRRRRDPRPRVGARQLLDIDDGAGARRPGPCLRRRDVLRRAVGPRSRRRGGAAEPGRRGVVDRREVHGAWRGEPDPAHVNAVDAYFCLRRRARHERLDLHRSGHRLHRCRRRRCLSGAIGALSGPLHGGAPSRVLKMLDEVAEHGDARAYVKGLLDRKQRLMGFGHRVYRAEDPRARVLRRTARSSVAAARGGGGAGERRAGRAEGAPPRPRARDQRGVLVGRRARLRPGARVRCSPRCSPVPASPAGRAHPRAEATGRLIRPSAKYVGPAPRPIAEVDGFASL